MALNATKKQKIADILAEEMYRKSNTMAVLNGDNIIAAITSIDNAMDTVISSIPGAWSSKTIKQALIDNLPEPFKSNSTAAQKALVMAYWAMSEGGLI